MLHTLFVVRPRPATLLALALTLGGCDTVDNPLTPEDPATVVLGRVSSITTGAAAAAPALSSGSRSLAGIEITVDGSPVTDLTNENGEFRLEVRGHEGRIRIRFRRGDIDVRLEFEGMEPGSVLQVEVSLSDHGATLLNEHHRHEGEFEGIASLLSVEGAAPNRSLRVSLVGDHGSATVEIIEGSTLIENEGDVTSFEDILGVLDRGDRAVEIEGMGERQDDGSLVASSVKVETDDDRHDDDNDDDDPNVEGPNEFEGLASLVSVNGEAPSRTIRVTLLGELGPATVDVIEGGTLFDNEGDLTSFVSLLAALEAGHPALRIEGDGASTEDGSIRATSLKAETDS